jgi:hypothetical protein
MDTSTFMEEALARLARIESALSVEHSHRMAPTDLVQIEAIAEAVARKIKAVESATLDARYLMSLPREERNRLAREEMRRQDREKKARSAKGQS